MSDIGHFIYIFIPTLTGDLDLYEQPLEIGPRLTPRTARKRSLTNT